jgi:hypothetical protein
LRRAGASKKTPDVSGSLLQLIKFTLQFFGHDFSLKRLSVVRRQLSVALNFQPSAFKTRIARHQAKSLSLLPFDFKSLPFDLLFQPPNDATRSISAATPTHSHAKTSPWAE